jgi:hypothetical protein
VVTPLVILFIVFKTKTKLFALAENSEITANGDNTQAPWQQPDHPGRPVCLQIMDERDSTNLPIYKLVQRPDDA